MDPLVLRINPDIVLRTLLLHSPKRGRQVHIPRQIKRLRAAELRLEPQADLSLVALAESSAHEIFVEALLVDASVVGGQRGGGRSSIGVGAHVVQDVVEDGELFGQGLLAGHVGAGA